MKQLAAKVSLLVAGALAICSGVAAANGSVSILPASSHKAEVEIEQGTTSTTADQRKGADKPEDDATSTTLVGGVTSTTVEIEDEPGDDNLPKHSGLDDDPATHDVGDDDGDDDSGHHQSGKTTSGGSTVATTSTTVDDHGGSSSGSGKSGSGSGSSGSGSSGSGKSASSDDSSHGGHGSDD